MEKMMFCNERDWTGLYKQTHSLWCAESYSHPAKMGPGLCYKIIKHLEEMGVMSPGSVVLDFLSGIGTTALCSCLKGYKAITIELEPKFVKLQEENKAYVEAKTYRKLDWTILQGDSRELSSILTEQGLIGLVIPPYGDSTINPGNVGNEIRKRWGQNKGLVPHSKDGYGQTEGQIGDLPDKLVGLVSPPYGSILGAAEHEGDQAKYKARAKYMARQQRYNAAHPEYKRPDVESFTHPDTLGQIANLPDKVVGIVSPPYAGGTGHGGAPTDLDAQKHIANWVKDQYGNTPGQIENFPDKVIAITSPPYDQQTQGGHTDCILSRGRDYAFMPYGNSEGQIGQEQGETYLSAMAQVYAEAAKVCSVLVCVVKDPTRDGKLRRLGRDTCRLLRQAGFEIFDYHRAILFTEQEQGHLFEGKIKKPKGRLSFFKRLSYQKGSPVANFEHVIFARRNGASLVGIVSPPYGEKTVGGTFIEDANINPDKLAWRLTRKEGKRNYERRMAEGYTSNPANIGNLKDV